MGEGSEAVGVSRACAIRDGPQYFDQGERRLRSLALQAVTSGGAEARSTSPAGRGTRLLGRLRHPIRSMPANRALSGALDQWRPNSILRLSSEWNSQVRGSSLMQGRRLEVVAPDHVWRQLPVLDDRKPRSVRGMDRAGRSGVLGNRLHLSNLLDSQGLDGSLGERTGDRREDHEDCSVDQKEISHAAMPNYTRHRRSGRREATLR